MRLITWNTAARVKKQGLQAEFLQSISPDAVALQEVTKSTIQSWIESLARMDLSHLVHTVELVGSGARRTGVLTASRWPLEASDDQIRTDWHEKVLSARLIGPNGNMEIHNVHVPPGSSNGWVKVEVLEAIYATLSACPNHPRILCGDFNLPKEEWPDGTVVTWAQNVDKAGRTLIGSRGNRWHLAEWNIAVGLQAFGLRDAYRSLHGYEEPAHSWVAKNRGREFPRRFDHVFTDVPPEKADYMLETLSDGLSDHAPLLVSLCP